ncbi:formimidoylglutamase [Corynebacterium lizhenjunii]|uniref:formimidoylglutamase n=1 Tax=Corynebacterium lizhenjunii TaxID=2709394 RepID=UPI0013E9DE40|nr:formimidoylglutamase [Corynebacterium lizhenjunii]
MNTVSAPELYTPAPGWSGRDDGPGRAHARWHSVISPATMSADAATAEAPSALPQAGVALLGFASDEGVARNGGRQGAAAGPDALRSALSSLAIHHPRALYDAGTITTQGEDLESAHVALSAHVARLRRAGNLVIVLGGGHETAFGSHRGAYQAAGCQPLQIINLDAHFDLRTATRATSGTPFKQIADLIQADHPQNPGAFDYTVLGISRPNNTAVLFETAAELGVRVVEDTSLLDSPAGAAAIAADAAATSTAAIHLSIDLDVLPAAEAPGVSAPAGLGVPFTHIRAMALAIAATGRLALVDIVELNPTYDIDSRTARLAARLIEDIVATHLMATSHQEF